MNGIDVMYDKRSQTDYEDSRSSVLFYTKDTATFNEDHSETTENVGEKEATFKVSVDSDQNVAMVYNKFLGWMSLWHFPGHSEY